MALKCLKILDKYVCVFFLVEMCPKFEGENVSEKFSAEIEFCRIGPFLSWPATLYSRWFCSLSRCPEAAAAMTTSAASRDRFMTTFLAWFRITGVCGLYANREQFFGRLLSLPPKPHRSKHHFFLLYARRRHSIAFVARARNEEMKYEIRGKK
jgi:hypothetical protein